MKWTEPVHPQYDHTDIPATLTSPKAVTFWAVALLTGIGAGIAAGALTWLLQAIEHLAWPGPDILEAGAHAGYERHLIVLIGAGVLTGVGQLVLQHVSSANGIDIVEAITRFAGRLPVVRTLGSALLSIVVVGMGAALGREGAPKQTGAVIASVLSDRARLSDEQRRLLVACGAGAGMAAAYGVPLGGAIFSLEVLRGVLALRLILPALLASATATAVSWLVLPNAPTYIIPAYPLSASVVCWALVAGPILGLVSIGYVRLIAWADRNKPRGWLRLITPVIALGLLGALSVAYPQLLGNGKDVAQLAFMGQVAPLLMLALLSTPGRHRHVSRQRGSRRAIYSFTGTRVVARRSSRVCLVTPLARCTARVICRAGRCRRLGGHDSRSHFRCRPDHGTHRPRPIIHVAAAGGGCNGDRCRAYAGCSLHLRCEIQ